MKLVIIYQNYFHNFKLYIKLIIALSIDKINF